MNLSDLSDHWCDVVARYCCRAGVWTCFCSCATSLNESAILTGNHVAISAATKCSFTLTLSRGTDKASRPDNRSVFGRRLFFNS
ncbi:hypothetical protein BIW11_04766 [Tropilaelaps mercedesae]|uniref:Uncharacterized protein n=1 Tax=Tropilaelaps mercedesae TaxID=418985 RepID=A0A1V9X1E7_9ACAR|nr:hypothetical protein BIW11_04766 [Tropilaelaps mercedesae]